MTEKSRKPIFSGGVEVKQKKNIFNKEGKKMLKKKTIAVIKKQ